MATPDEIRTVIDTYVERFSAGDAAGWAALFSTDATHEDPVGTEANVGRDAIQGFYERSVEMFGSLAVARTGEVVVAGNEAAVTLEAFAGSGAGRVHMPHIIDTIRVDDDGLIEQLRAYWQFDSVVPAPEEPGRS
ncbi:MAG: putative 3-ketosteroid 5-isomerase [Acidimicrobiales bacterium]|nr:putative 3-ketosteroid 5-isomerase [Acidimicrobiales bacterium]